MAANSDDFDSYPTLTLVSGQDASLPLALTPQILGFQAECFSKLEVLLHREDVETSTDPHIAWLRFASHIDCEMAYQLRQASRSVSHLLRSISETGAYQVDPLRDISSNITGIDSCLSKIINGWEEKVATGNSASISYTASAVFEEIGGAIKQLELSVPWIKGRVDSRPKEKQIELWRYIDDTYTSLDNLLIWLKTYRERIIVAEARRQEARKALNEESGIRQRKNVQGNRLDDEDSHDPSEEWGGMDKQSTSNRITSSRISVYNGLTFPAFFYNSPRATPSKILQFIYDRSTLWSIVFTSALASGILAGMAFFNPTVQFYAFLSQTCRLWASLWCFIIPLMKDKDLPIWPARGWLFGSVVLSAMLSISSVVLCYLNESWSGLIVCLADFVALGASAMLAVGLVDISANAAAGTTATIGRSHIS